MSARDFLQSGAERIASIVRKRFPGLTYGGHYTYRVVSVMTNGRMSLESVDGDMDPIPAVDQWTASGFTGRPVVGSEVLVIFRDGRPNRPAVVAMQAVRIGGGVPTVVTVNASSAVNVGPDASSVVLGGSGAVALAKAPPLVTWATAATTSLGQIVGYINGIAPGTVTAVPALAAPATTKVTGV